MPIGLQPQRGLVGRSGFGRVNDENLVGIARWVERLVLNGEIANERMMVGLGSRGPALHVVFSVISPGVTESELAESISDAEAREAVREYRAVAIPASAIADAIAFAIGQPPEVDVNEIIVRPAMSTH